MPRTARIAIVLSIAMPGAAAAAQAGDAPNPPGWLSGCWEQTAPDGWVEECWTDSRGGMMLGTGRSGAGNRVVAWETMQILPGPEGSLAFWASPGGRARVRFEMVSQTPREIVFANPSHDYPQRVRYRFDGKGIIAETSLLDGSRPMRWTYRRAR